MTQADKIAINTNIIDIRLSIPSENAMQDYTTTALNNLTTNETLKIYLKELILEQNNIS